MVRKPEKWHRPKSAPSMESISVGQVLSCTLSPPDGRNMDTAKSNSVRLTSDYLKRVTVHKELINKLYGAKLILYPELSPTGRLHYHGTVTIKDPFAFYYHDLYLLEEIMYEIDTIGSDREGASGSKATNMDKWMAYCQKQKSIMQKVHEDLGIQYPIENGYHRTVTIVDSTFENIIERLD